MTQQPRQSEMSYGPGRTYKRNLRNLLLQPRFQLKYTLMVVTVALLVAGTLGAIAYHYSRGQTKLLTIHKMEQAMEGGQEIGDQFVVDLQNYAAEEDMKVLVAIVLGIVALLFAIAGTGIVVTHRLVGPAYRLKALIKHVRNGHMQVAGRLRKGDELQDVFDAFQEMVDALRKTQREEIAMLDTAIESVRSAGLDENSLQELERVRARMQAVLD